MDYKDFTLEDWVDYIYELIKNEEVLDRNDMRCLLLSLIKFLLATLNQEFILNKVRTEIEALEYLNIEDGFGGHDKYIEQYEVLKILDKYKKEGDEV